MVGSGEPVFVMDFECDGNVFIIKISIQLTVIVSKYLLNENIIENSKLHGVKQIIRFPYGLSM